MAWTNRQVFNFLDLYEGENLLWNSGHVHHKRKQKVKDAWMRIAGVLRLPVAEVKAKKNILMSSYRRQRKSIGDSITSGASDVYEPQWFAYSRMDSFLRGVDDCGKTQDSLPNNYYQAVIKYVKHNPCIWDKQHPYHKNIRILGKHWKVIADKLGKKEKDVKMIWKNLCQEFRKQWLKAEHSPPGVSALETALLSGQPEEPTWPFYEQMLFMKDQMGDTPEYQEENSNVSLLAPDDIMHSDEEDFQPSMSPIPGTSYEDHPPHSDTSGHSSNNIFPRKTPQMILGESLLSIEAEQQRLRQRDEDRDDNFNFLRSLLPQMKRLDQQKNTLFRVEMQGRLYSLLYGDPQQPQQCEQLYPSKTEHDEET